jgi:hypothetical protein
MNGKWKIKRKMILINVRGGKEKMKKKKKNGKTICCTVNSNASNSLQKCYIVNEIDVKI